VKWEKVFPARPSLERSGGWGIRECAFAVVCMALLLRLVYGGWVELLPEETYYWNYARHLDIGYLDHPPLVGWLIEAGRRAFGDVEFGVRVGAICCGAVATVFMYRLTRHLFGWTAGWVSVVLVQVLPFFFLSGLLMTPDAPLTAAWSGELYFLERALLGGRRWGWWGAGLCLGVGLLSKYTILLLVAATVVFVLWDERSRIWLRRVEPYGALVLACGLFLPVIVWNAQHEWASFLFQTSRRLAERPQFALGKLLGSALVLLTPLGFAGAVWALMGRGGVAEERAGPGEEPGAPDEAAGGPAVERGAARRRVWRFLKCATWVPVGVFALFSLRHEVKLDWTGAAWVGAIPALSQGIVCAGPGLKRTWAATVAGLLVFYGAGFYELTVGIPGVGYARHAELMPVGWRQLGREIAGKAEEVGEGEGREPLVVGMDRYAIASELAFYGSRPGKSQRETSSGHLFGQMGLMYERWVRPEDVRGRTLLMVGWSAGELSGGAIEGSVERLGPIEEGHLERKGELIRPYYYRLAYGYRGHPALDRTGAGQ
jgi:dolichol-phosphate mannosyltransferase